MHLSSQTLSAAGDSPWIIANPLLHASDLGLAVTFSSNANLTANVQYTYDDPTQNARPVTLARAGVNLTVTDPAHNLNVGDAVQLSNPNSDPNNIWGGAAGSPPGSTYVAYDVASITDQNNYVLTVANAGSAAGGGAVRSFRLFLHPTLKNLLGVPPARIDGNIDWPIGAVRLNVGAYAAGSVTLTVQTALGN